MKKMICASHKFTIKDERNGEMAARSLSDKAYEVYEQADPMTIYEYRDTDNNKLYAFDGPFGSDEGLTFEELETYFEDIYDDMFSDSFRYGRTEPQIW